MLDTITATPAPATAATRWRIERDEYGRLSGPAGGLFIACVVPGALPDVRDETGHQRGGWIPDGLLL